MDPILILILLSIICSLYDLGFSGTTAVTIMMHDWVKQQTNGDAMTKCVLVKTAAASITRMTKFRLWLDDDRDGARRIVTLLTVEDDHGVH